MGLLTPLRLESRRDGGVSVVAAYGEIDIATCGEAEAALEDARRSASTVVFDLRGVEFMDTSGLRLIFGEHQRARTEGLRFVVVRGPANVQRLFDIAGLGAVEDLFVDTPDELAEAGSS